ncbi:MAG: helix-hairpin-helix domain-containing protein, partial [Nitriliruptoraceae bacterium]
RRVTASVLDDVPGIGPARRRALLDRFGSAARVAEASIDELATTEGISRTLATTVREHLAAHHEDDR